MKTYLYKININYVKLIFRFILFIILVSCYLISKVNNKDYIFNGLEENRVFIGLLWIILITEMLYKIIPNNYFKIGNKKHFSKNFLGNANNEFKKIKRTKTFWCAFAWIFPNLVFFVLFYLGFLDEGMMYILASIYSICDMICILYFCPFKKWILKNKCCTTCRIYNWDSIFMFTPFIVIHNFFTISLVIMAIIVLIQWEYIYKKHPERFYEQSNENLKCKNCKSKSCMYKKNTV